MGKKSLTKSTSKKKTTKKKSTAKTTSKKTVSTSSKAKKTTPKKATAKKKPTLKTLRKKDFGTWAPETMYAPEPETAHFSAPPVIATDDKKTAEKLRSLLDKKFEPAEKKKAAPKKTQKKKTAKPAAAKKPSAPKKPKKKTPSREDLLQKPFDSWKPEKPFTPAEDKEAAGQFAAPPFTVDIEPEKLRELLFREFDLSKVTPKPPSEPKEKAPEKEVTEKEKPAEPETAEPAAAQEPVAEAPESEPATPEAETAEPEPAASEPEPPAEKSKSEKPPKAAKPSPKTEQPKKPSPPPSGGGGEPPIPPSPSGPQEPPSEPMSNGLKILIGGVAALFACLIIASAMNSGKYYIKETSKGTEVWKGDFAPKGKKMIIALENVKPAEDVADMVSKQKAYTLPFNYFMTRAEKLSEKPGIPDFEAIRKELKKAKKYAVSQSQIKRVSNRLKHIDFTFLLYKAEMAADQATAKGYDKALKYLKDARELAATGPQANLVKKRIQAIKAARSGSEKSDAEPKAETDNTECPAEQKDADADKAQSTDKDKDSKAPAKSKIKQQDKPKEEDHIM